MRTAILLAAAAMPTALVAQSVPAVRPGGWQSVTTVSELSVPGVPKFLLSMAKGKAQREAKCIAPDQATIGALIAPKASGKCRVLDERIVGNRFEQQLQCPQKEGGAMTIARSGTLAGDTLTARVLVTGDTKKGPMRVTASQVIRHTGKSCRT